MKELWRRTLSCVAVTALLFSAGSLQAGAAERAGDPQEEPQTVWLEEGLVTAQGETDEVNLFLGKTATAGNSETSKGNIPENAVDGDETTKWCGPPTTAEKEDPALCTQWWQVDLGGLYELSHVRFLLEKDAKNGIVANNVVFKYKIAVSADNPEMTEADVVIDKSKNEEVIVEADESLAACGPVRYVRIYLNCATTLNWPALMEVYGYGTRYIEPSGGVSLSFGEAVEVEQGETFTLPLKISGLDQLTAPLYAMQAKVVLPEGITCTGVNAADNVDGTLTFYQSAGRNECFILYDADAQSGLPTAAERLLTLECRAVADAAAGQVQVALADPIALTYGAEALETSLTPLSVTIIEAEEPTPDPVLTGIAVANAPSKTAYTAGEKLDLTGLTIKASYSDGSEKDIALADFAAAGVTTAPENGAVLSEADVNVTITLSGKTASQAVTVAEDEPYVPSYPGPNSTTKTEKNPDGSTTTTVIKSNGTKTETVKWPDGATAKTVTKPDGSMEYTAKTADGITAGMKQDAAGKGSAEVTVPGAAIGENGSVTLPLPEVRAARDGGQATEVTVTLPKDKNATVTIPVKNAGPGVVAVEILPDGSEQIIISSAPAEGGISLPVEGGATVKLVDRTVTFADVDAKDWAYDGVTFAAARGLFQGTGEGRFDGGMSTTRATLMTILARADGQDAADGETWYEKGLAWAVEHGISDGSAPSEPITREQMITMLYRCAGSPESTGELSAFIDADRVSAYAEPAMGWAVGRSLLTGKPGGLIDPEGLITRAEAATILQRYLSCGK